MFRNRATLACCKVVFVEKYLRISWYQISPEQRIKRKLRVICSIFELFLYEFNSNHFNYSLNFSTSSIWKFTKKRVKRSWEAIIIPIYWKVSMLMTSMTGQTTLVGSSATLSKRGSNQSALHSQCESRNVNTLAVAASAPRTLDLIKPSLFSLRITRTLCILDSSSPSSAAKEVNELLQCCSMHSSGK